MTTLTSAQLGDMMADLGIDNTQVVSIFGSPTGGTFTLTYLAQTTAAIAYNATSDAVQSALAALSSIGVGNVSVQAAPGGPYTIALYNGLPQTAISIVSSLTGSTSQPSVSVTQLIVFSDAALQRLYDRATAVTTVSATYELAIAYGFRQLLSAATKLHDTRLGVVSESLNQVTTHLEAQYALWAKLAGISGGLISMGNLSLVIDEPFSVSMQTAITNYLNAYRNA